MAKASKPARPESATPTEGIERSAALEQLKFGYCDDILACLALSPDGAEVGRELAELVTARILPRRFVSATFDRSLGLVIQLARVEKRGERLAFVWPGRKNLGALPTEGVGALAANTFSQLSLITTRPNLYHDAIRELLRSGTRVMKVDDLEKAVAKRFKDTGHTFDPGDFVLALGNMDENHEVQLFDEGPAAMVRGLG